MQHPNQSNRDAQAKFLEECNPKDRRFHELAFMIGNAAFIYHQRAKSFQPTEQDWKEWLEGLPEQIRPIMLESGFEGCLGILSFTRYVNEKNDLGFDAFLQQNISPGDLKEYNDLLNK